MGSGAQEAISARTLSILGMYGGDTFGGPAEGTVTAYRLTGQGLSPVRLVRNRRFADFATDWEKGWSGLIDRKSGSGWVITPVSPLPPLDPVVDANGVVVGHFGWVNGWSLLIPQSSRGNGLRDLLLDGALVFVKSPVSGAGQVETYNNVNFVRPYTTEERFQLVMDVEGRVLAQSSYDVVGLESADNTFWLLVSVGSLVVGLGRLAGRRLIAGNRPEVAA